MIETRKLIESKAKTAAAFVLVLALLFTIFAAFPAAVSADEETGGEIIYQTEDGTREFSDSTLTSRQSRRSADILGYVMWGAVAVCIVLIFVYIGAERSRRKKEQRQKKLEARPRLIITSGYHEEFDEDLNR